MSNFIEKLKKSGMLWVAVAIAAFVIIAVTVFLGKDDGGVSGLSILAQQKWHEWFWMAFGAVGSVAVVYGFLRYYKKVQDVRGIKLFAIALGVFLGIAFGKACTDKANDGVTSGSGRVGGASAKDTTRVAAEDLIPKK